MFWIVLGCYSYMFKKKGLRHRRRRAESQAQLPVRYLSRDSKFKPKSMPAVDSKFKPKSMPAVDSKFKPKSMPAVRYISYLDSVSIQGRAWRRSDRRHARGVSGAVESFSYPRSDRTGVSGVVWDCESGDLDIGYTGIRTILPLRLSIESQSRIPESLALEIDNRHSLILKSARVADY